MKNPWFKAKDYGWGWYPATWQGWAVMVGWLIAVVVTFQGIDADSHSASDTLIPFFAHLILLTGLLIIICIRTGERPTWRWAGKPVTPRVVLGWTVAILAIFMVAMFAMRFALFHLR